MDAKKSDDDAEWRIDLDGLVREMQRAATERRVEDDPSTPALAVPALPARAPPAAEDAPPPAPDHQASAAAVASSPVKRRRPAVVLALVLGGVLASSGATWLGRRATPPVPGDTTIAVARPAPPSAEKRALDAVAPREADARDPALLPAARSTALTPAALAPAPPKGAPAEPARVRVADLPAEAADAGHSLGAAMKDAVGADEPAPNTTSELATPAARHLHPPVGALNAALNAALPGARACLPEGASVAHATVVFDATGASTATVRDAPSPDVARCITGALARVRVEPFVEAPYSVPVAIRP